MGQFGLLVFRLESKWHWPKGRCYSESKNSMVLYRKTRTAL